MYHQYKDGTLEVITGCMFAGKTEELIRRVNVLRYANKNIIVFKPKVDNRFSDAAVVSHAGNSMESVDIASALEILDHVLPEHDVVAIDEIQFFEDEVLQICEYLALQGKRVMVAGLDMDFRGEPFGVIPALMTHAEFVTKLTAVCTVCGAPATRTQRLVDDKPASYHDPIVMIGASEAYEARCRHDHQVSNKPKVK